MDELKVYKQLPEWNAETLPKGFREKHNTKDGTWAQLVVKAGTLRFTELDADGNEQMSTEFDSWSGPQLIQPGQWHKVEPVDDEMCCQVSFLCESSRYYQMKHKLSAPHSALLAALPELQSRAGRSVLDLGSGRGRNAFFLTEKGFQVHAVDKSETAIATLQGIQSAEDVIFPTSVYDINEARLRRIVSRGVDHVISTVVFQFLEADKVPVIVRDLQQVTRPGGVHLIVAPVSSQDVPCPLPFPFTFKRGELRDYYADWDILQYSEEMGEFHKEDENGERYKAEFATLLAAKRR